MPGLGLIGLGRVGRGVVRELHRRGLIDQIRVISELAPARRSPEQHTVDLAYLLAHDSTYGPMPATVEAKGREIIIDGHAVAVSHEPQPGRVPWDVLGVDLVVEATGDPAVMSEARTVLQGGVQRVLLTGYGEESEVTLVRGVNWGRYDPDAHRLIGCSTCTANALGPILKSLLADYGINRVAITSVHPALSNDTFLDSPGYPAAAGRSGLTVRAVPSGMARSLAQLLPGLNGKITALSLRVPTATVNALVVDVDLQRPPRGRDQVQAAFEQYAAGELKGVLRLDAGFFGRCRTAADFIGDPHSAVIDLNWVDLVDGGLRFLVWHDNEFAYCCRVVDLVQKIMAVDAARRAGSDLRPAGHAAGLGRVPWRADGSNRVQLDAASAMKAGRETVRPAMTTTRSII